MAENKKTFIFYSDWGNMIKEMPDEDAGKLLKHILSYVNDDDPTTDNLLVKMAFGHMKPLLKADLIKWADIREKRKGYGKKGGEAKAKQKVAKAKQVEAVNDNVNVNVNDNVNKKENKKRSESPLNSFSTEVEETYLKILSFFPKDLHPSNNIKVIRWKAEIEKLNRIDKYSFAKIYAVVKWARSDEFWKKQFLSMMKLRTLNKQKVQVFKYLVVQMEDFKENGDLKTYSYDQMTKMNDTDKETFKKYKSIKYKNKTVWVKNEDIEKFNLKTE